MATETKIAEKASGHIGRVASRVPLSRERIVDSAMDLVERHGLPGLTTRRLGAALGCEAMSIYHHFPSRQHLLDALVERAIAGVAEPPSGANPVERLRFIGYEYRRVAHRHPRLFPLLALHRLNMPAGVAFIERMLRHFHDALPDDKLAAQAFRLFGYYVIGAALDEHRAMPKVRRRPNPSATTTLRPNALVSPPPHRFSSAPISTRRSSSVSVDLKGIAESREALLARARAAPKPTVRPKS